MYCSGDQNQFKKCDPVQLDDMHMVRTIVLGHVGSKETFIQAIEIEPHQEQAKVEEEFSNPYQDLFLNGQSVLQDYQGAKNKIR